MQIWCVSSSANSVCLGTFVVVVSLFFSFLISLCGFVYIRQFFGGSS